MHPVREACTRFRNRREREGTGSVYTLREQDESFCITLKGNNKVVRIPAFINAEIVPNIIRRNYREALIGALQFDEFVPALP